MSLEIGPRQTVDRAKHPTLGEGRAIYDNGPAFFWPDGADPVPMNSISVGGAGPGSKSWCNAVTSEGQRVELDTTDRAHGDRHYRRWHPHHGPGWLVAIGGASWRKGGPTERWEGDNGTTFSMRVASVRVGKPSDWKKNGDMRDDISEEHENWFTYELDSGETFVFRAAPPEDLPYGSDEPIGKLGKLKQQHVARRTTYDPRPAPSSHPPPLPPGSRWPDPNAPRSEVDAFVARAAR